MPIYTNIRQGQIYWLADCEPLDGDHVKDRPVIVLDSPANLRSRGIIKVVACSTHPRKRDAKKILIPNRNKLRETGLPIDCWVIPRWYLNINGFRLTNLQGNCPEQLLIEILIAVNQQIEIDESP